jgi:hypothetical protein
MDFIIDGLATGRMVRILSVVDAYTRECLALEADTSLGSGRVTRVLERLIGERGRPANLRSDNGTEVHAGGDLPGSQAPDTSVHRRSLRRVSGQAVARGPSKSHLPLEGATGTRLPRAGEHRPLLASAAPRSSPSGSRCTTTKTCSSRFTATYSLAHAQRNSFSKALPR